MPDRIHSSETQLLIDGNSIPAITSLSVNSTKDVTNINTLGSMNVKERVLNSNQVNSINIELNLTTGATGVDPFYQFQEQGAGFLSTGKFKLRISDNVGSTVLNDASITSYNVKGSVGSLVEGSIGYQATNSTFGTSDALVPSDEREDTFGGFFRPQNVSVTSVTDGKEGIESSDLNIQDFDISINISREPIKRLGVLEPAFTYPQIPAAGNLTFNTIKNSVTGIDLSQLICDSGVITINLQDDSNETLMRFTTSGCCLESVDESTNLDDNTQVTFSYYFPIIL